jgi:hypothetical protein
MQSLMKLGNKELGQPNGTVVTGSFKLTAVPLGSDPERAPTQSVATNRRAATVPTNQSPPATKSVWHSPTQSCPHAAAYKRPWTRRQNTPLVSPPSSKTEQPSLEFTAIWSCSRPIADSFHLDNRLSPPPSTPTAVRADDFHLPPVNAFTRGPHHRQVVA